MQSPAKHHHHAATSLQNRAITGAVWISIEMAGVQAISFVVFATIAHFVVPRDFGLMSMSFLAIQSIQSLVLHNVSTVAVRKQKAESLDFTTAFWIMISLASLASLALLAMSPVLARLFHAPGLEPVLHAMSIVLLFSGLSQTHEAWLLRNFRFRSLALRGLIGSLAGGAVGITLAVNGFGVYALVGQQITNSTICVLLLWLVCPWRPSFNFSLDAAAEIMIYMRGILPNSAVYVINQNSDTFLVALFFGPASAGIYNVGKRIRLALQLVAGEPVKSIALPALAEIQDDPARLRRGVLSSLTFICMVCCPAFFGASAVSHEAINVVFGAKWAAAVPVMQLLSLAGASIALLAFNDNIFVLLKRPIWCLYVSLTYTALAVVGVLLCVKFEVRSLALPFVLPYLIAFPLSAMMLANAISLRLTAVFGAMLPGVGAATAMFVILQLLRPYISGYGSIVSLIGLCLVGGISYIVIIFVFWPGPAKQAFALLSQLGRQRVFQK